MISNNSKYLLNWIGGKRLLRPRIAELVPENIATYIEPFGGGGWVLFYRDKWANLEVYNDLDDRLVNLFKCVKYHPDELYKEFRWMMASRKMFKETLESIPQTDIQKASKFLYLITRSFGGNGRNFGTSKKNSGSSKSQNNILLRIEAIHKRLDKVIIENLDYKKIFETYDYQDAFFYCDPPYSCGTGYETVSTKDFEHEKLRNNLKKLKGRFLLSYDDSPVIRKLYKGFNIVEVSRQKGINNKNTKDNVYRELLISNYKA